MGYAGLATGAAGSIISTIGNLIKTKVKLPDYVPVNTSAEEGKAINANIANLPENFKLGSATNDFTQAELLKAIRTVVPNFDQLSAKMGTNLAAKLSGEIPPDVAAAIVRHSAAAGVANGTSGSNFSGNLTTRDLGLTSLDQINSGMTQTNQWLSNVRQNLTAPQYNPSSMWISPAQQIQVTAANNEGQYNHDFLNNQLKASQSTASIVGAGLEQFGASLGSSGSMSGLFKQGTTPTSSSDGSHTNYALQASDRQSGGYNFSSSYGDY